MLIKRLIFLLGAALGVLVFAEPSAAQEQFSRERFLDALKTPLGTLAASNRPWTDVHGRRIGPSVRVDANGLQSDKWSDLIEIPQLSMLTQDKKAGYLLGLAYLASQELNIPIETKELPTLVVIKAEGLFVANVFHGPRPPVVDILQNFRVAATQLLENAADPEGACEFRYGWYRNASSEIDFLKRTCKDLRTVVAAAREDLDRAKASAAAQMRTEMVAVTGEATSDTLSDDQEVARRAKLSPDDLTAGLDAINGKIAETRAKRDSLSRTGGKVHTLAPSSTMSEQDRETQVQLLNAQLEMLGHEASLQTAALQAAQARIKKIQEAKRLREEAERAAARKAAIEAYMQSEYGKEALDACLTFRRRWQPQQAHQLAQLGMPPESDSVYKAESLTACRTFVTEHLRGYEEVGPLVWRSILEFLRTGRRIPYDQPSLDVNAFLLRSGVLFSSPK